MKYRSISTKLELSDEQMEIIKSHMSEMIKALIEDEVFFEFRKQMKSLIKEVLYDPLEEKFTVLFKNMEKCVNKTLGKIEKNSEHSIVELSKILDSNLNVEEYIANMLLAIRQNEYLQAYYPAQKGYPEMNVIGKHPSKVNDKLAS